MNVPRIAAAGVLLTSTVAFAVVAGHAAGAAPGARSRSASSPMAQAGSFAPGRLLVQFRAGISGADRAAVVRGVGARDAGPIRDLGIRILRVPAGAEQRIANALLRSGKVASAERDGIVSATDVTPDDPYWANQWGIKKIGTPATWTTSTGAAAVTVAVLDSGLNTSLPEFAGRVLPGYNFVANNTDVTDDNSHGTAVAGIVAAKGNNATGVAGMCWACSILPVKVLDANAIGTDSAVGAGITWATDHGAQVINLSLGTTSQSSAQAKAVAYAQSKGVLVVAAAGNNGSSAPFYPANYPGVVSVAASDQLDRLYSYSEYGSWVDVAAPGSGYSVWPSGSCFNFSGTSAASPVVAGLAGLLFSARPGSTAADVTQAIVSTTDPLAAGTVAAGRVDAAKAMAALTGGVASPSPIPTASSPASSSPAPAPSPSTSTSAAPTSASASTGPTTASFAGSVNAKASKSFALATAGGPVSATVTGVSTPVTVSILSSDGTTLMSAYGSSGVTVNATLPRGAFSVVVSSANKTKFSVSVSYYA